MQDDNNDESYYSGELNLIIDNGCPDELPNLQDESN